jgi:hypothetical protein
MADKKLLKLEGGEIQQLQAGDTYVIPDGSTATTQSINDNSTKVATTAYVDNSINNDYRKVFLLGGM